MSISKLTNPITGKPQKHTVKSLKEKKHEDVERAKQKVRDEGKPQKKTSDSKTKKKAKKK